jgi:molecular chaperone HtpG
MSATTGTLSIHTENIFPIIKKFLYSNQEVFLRELVSNATDATQKLRTLASTGEFKGELGELRIRIAVDAEAKTLTISDSGIGMTAEEVEKYINQIAFSSAEEFLEKYKDASPIIGHFGLGFYSAFMVAERVEIFTRSWKEGAEAVHWTCTGTTEYSLEPTEKELRGTDIVLHLAEDSLDYAKAFEIETLLKKYCRFLPIEIEFEGKVINNTTPLWTSTPSELTDEDYTKFYTELYGYGDTPLFWIHLNVDYPFTLKGILYFPKLKPNADFQKNRIQLYANQVFVTDHVEDIVPEYLALLQGVIDSPDIPLNVSRSSLQTDANVRKINSHISKKVADKLNELFAENRSAYEQKWESIGVFVKYGMLRDDSFYDRVKKACLLYDTEKNFYTFEEFTARIAANQTDKDGNVVWLYATDSQEQHVYIDAAVKRGYTVLLFDGMLDSHLISFLEMRNDKTKMVRVDSDLLDRLIDKGIEQASPLNEEETKTLEELYKSALGDKMFALELAAGGETDLPVAAIRPEQQRRFRDMSRVGMMGGMEMPDFVTLVVNTHHPLAKKLLLMPEGADRNEKAHEAIDLALLSQGLLQGADLVAYIEAGYKRL